MPPLASITTLQTLSETFLIVPFPVFHLHQLERPSLRSAVLASLAPDTLRLDAATPLST